MKLSQYLMLVTWSKGLVAVRMGASHCKSATCLVWCLWVFCRWRYVFNLSHDLTWPPHWESMRIYGWELLVLCHYADKPCDHRHCDGGDMFLICHIISLEHMFKWLCEFLGGTRHGQSPSCHVWWSLVYTLFFITKPFFCLSLNFLNIILICKLRWNFPNNFRNFYAFISYNCIFS